MLENVESTKEKTMGVNEMGIVKDIARLTSYCGNKILLCSNKTCLVRTITKERLSKTGLIGPYDYYISRTCAN